MGPVSQRTPPYHSNLPRWYSCMKYAEISHSVTNYTLNYAWWEQTCCENHVWSTSHYPGIDNLGHLENQSPICRIQDCRDRKPRSRPAGRHRHRSQISEGRTSGRGTAGSCWIGGCRSLKSPFRLILVLSWFKGRHMFHILCYVLKWLEIAIINSVLCLFSFELCIL